MSGHHIQADCLFLCSVTVFRLSCRLAQQMNFTCEPSEPFFIKVLWLFFWSVDSAWDSRFLNINLIIFLQKILYFGKCDSVPWSNQKKNNFKMLRTSHSASSKTVVIFTQPKQQTGSFRHNSGLESGSFNHAFLEMAAHRLSPHPVLEDLQGMSSIPAVQSLHLKTLEAIIAANKYALGLPLVF